MNAALQVDACIVKSDPYEVGWLYAVPGRAGGGLAGCAWLCALLQETIQKMQEAGYGDEE